MQSVLSHASVSSKVWGNADVLMLFRFQSQPLWNIGCTLGAAVTTCETKGSPSPTAQMSMSSLQYEDTGTQSYTMNMGSAVSYSPYFSSSSSSFASSGDVTTQGFYCKSTVPHVGRHMNNTLAQVYRPVWVSCFAMK